MQRAISGTSAVTSKLKWPHSDTPTWGQRLESLITIWARDFDTSIVELRFVVGKNSLLRLFVVFISKWTFVCLSCSVGYVTVQSFDLHKSSNNRTKPNNRKMKPEWIASFSRWNDPSTVKFAEAVACDLWTVVVALGYWQLYRKWRIHPIQSDPMSALFTIRMSGLFCL